MCGPHQSDGNPNLELTARPRLLLPPLCGEATGYTFQGSCRLHTQQATQRGIKGGEVPALLEACHQVHALLFPLRLLQSILH